MGMVDRESLKDKAKSAGKSVAGTLAQGAQALKEKAKTIREDPESGISISEVDDQYLVIDSDGSAIGPYSDRKQAAAKARELKREKGQSEVAGQEQDDSDGNFATGFSKKVNETIAGSGADNSDDDEPGRIQQFATNFAESVNESVSEASESDTEGGPGIGLAGDDSGGPELRFLGDPDNDGDAEFAFMGDVDDDNQPDMGILEMNDNQGQSQLPGFGMGGRPESQEPGREQADPTMPGLFDPVGEPTFPDFDSPEESDDDREKPAWMI